MLDFKMTDRTLTIVQKFFVIMALFALAVGLYDFVKGHTESLEVSSCFTFILLSLFCKFYYAIMYWCKKIDIINTEERERQLHSGEMKEK